MNPGTIQTEITKITAVNHAAMDAVVIEYWIDINTPSSVPKIKELIATRNHDLLCFPTNKTGF